jgi:hypothetical protein
VAPDAARFKARARAHRRRFLRRGGWQASTFDTIAAAHLELWARCMAQLDALDAEGCAGDTIYVTTANTATRALHRVENRLREVGLIETKPRRRTGVKLQEYLAARDGGET